MNEVIDNTLLFIRQPILFLSKTINYVSGSFIYRLRSTLSDHERRTIQQDASRGCFAQVESIRSRVKWCSRTPEAPDGEYFTEIHCRAAVLIATFVGFGWRCNIITIIANCPLSGHVCRVVRRAPSPLVLFSCPLYGLRNNKARI